MEDRTDTPRLPRLYTKQEAAEALRLAPETIDKMRRAGRIRAVKPGANRVLFLESEILRVIGQAEQPAGVA